MKKATILSSVLLVLLVTFFPSNLGRELVVVPRWRTAADEASSSMVGGSDTVIPFAIGERFGYVTPDGLIVYAGTRVYDVAMSTEHFVNYSNVSGNLVIQDRTGRVVTTLTTPGYPHFVEDRLFVIGGNRASVEEWQDLEAPLWRREFASTITCLDAAPEAVMIGLLDGRLLLLDRNGEQIGVHRFDDGRFNVVYSCAVARSEDRGAVVHGLDPQFVTGLQWTHNELTPYGSIALEDEMRSSRLVRSTSDGGAMVGGIGAIHLVSGTWTRSVAVPVRGTTSALVEAGDHGLVVAATRDDSEGELIFARMDGSVLLRADSGSPVVSMESFDSRLVIGVDGYLAGFDLELR